VPATRLLHADTRGTFSDYIAGSNCLHAAWRIGPRFAKLEERLMAIFDSVLDTVGRTPVVRLQRLAPEGVNLYVKLEAANPMGSVKDRAALAIIEQAEASGELRPGQTVVEATSGNTGISLAMVCARKGYPLVVVMAENFSVERRRLMRFLGARVVLTPAAEKGSGMLAKAEELARERTAGSCAASSRTRPTPRSTRAPRRGDPGRLRRHRAGLLGDRRRHRGHAHRRGPHAAPSTARHPHRRVRAGQRPGARQRHCRSPRATAGAPPAIRCSGRT
jgi:hypothetical protein